MYATWQVRIRYEVVRHRFLDRMSGLPGAYILSPKLFAEMIMEVCDAPQGDYKLGVTRIFLRHRAAQVLESLEPLAPDVLEPLVRSKVAAFWDAASRIRDRLLTYHHHRKFREFMRGVLVAQKVLRMWLSQTRYRRTLTMANRIQHAYRGHVLRMQYWERRTRRDAILKVQAVGRAYLASREYKLKLNAIGKIQLAYRAKHPTKVDETLLDVISGWFARLGWAKEQNDASKDSARLLLTQLAGAQPRDRDGERPEDTAAAGAAAALAAVNAASVQKRPSLYNFFGLIGEEEEGMQAPAPPPAPPAAATNIPTNAPPPPPVLRMRMRVATPRGGAVARAKVMPSTRSQLARRRRRRRRR